MGRYNIALFLVLLSLFCTVNKTIAAVEKANRPNILFIYPDDHSYKSIGAYGSKINQTPHIDRLAREGMRFNHCYVTNSICGPMRAVIQTGKYSHLNGFFRNDHRLDGSQQTFPKLLQQIGYQTALVGKWHLGNSEAPQGYNYSEVLIGQGPYYNPQLLRDPKGNGKRVTKSYAGYTTHVITDLALDWLKHTRDTSKPFMLMVQHKAPHGHWDPGPNYLTKYDEVTIWEPPTLFDETERKSLHYSKDMDIEISLSDRALKLAPPSNLTPAQLKQWNLAYGPKNAAFHAAKLEGRDLLRWKYQRYIKDYLRCVAALDDDLGRILNYLDASGLAENTVVIYTSDQGLFLGEHGWYDKRWMYEESLRTPFIVRWPGVIAPGSVNDDIVSPLDFAATFLDIAGGEVPGDMQGRSLVPILQGRTPDDWRTSHYYHYYEGGGHGVPRHRGVTDRRYKLIHFYEAHIDEWELYDLQKDPLEINDLIANASYTDIRARLRDELEQLRTAFKVPKQDPPESYGGWAYAKLISQDITREAAKVQRKLVFQTQNDNKITAKVDLKYRPIVVGARIKPLRENGVIVAAGGDSHGFSLYLKDGVVIFLIRSSKFVVSVKAQRPLSMGQEVHVAAKLDENGTMYLFIDGEQVASGRGFFVSSNPVEGLDVGTDTGSFVGPYKNPIAFIGDINDVRVYEGVFPSNDISRWARASAMGK